MNTPRKSRAERRAARAAQPNEAQMINEEQTNAPESLEPAQPDVEVTSIAPAAAEEIQEERQFARGETPSLQHLDDAGYTEGAQQDSVSTQASSSFYDTRAAVVTTMQAPASQPEETEELPVADHNDTPSMPTGFTSPHAISAFHTVIEYVQAMHPRRPLAAAEMLRQQVGLYRAITNLINKVEGEEFTRAWNWLLQQFSLYRTGVFAERYVFRGFEDIALPEIDRKAFQRLLNLLKATSDPRGRQVALRQIDLPKTLELGVTEPGRQRVMQFYGA